jgi:ABC-type Fe3+-siderophore transport system permease subunit
MVWFTFGMISPRAIPVAIVVSLVSAFMIIYIMRSTRVNVTYRNRVPE